MGHPEFPTGRDRNAFQSRGPKDAWPSHGVSRSGARSILCSGRLKSFSRPTGFREAVARNAAGLEHISVFLCQPQSPFRSDGSDRFRSRRLQSASRQSVHGNRGGQYQYAQEPGRWRAAATRSAKRIFQTVGRSADDQFAFRRRGHDLVARCEFRIRCGRNSSNHFEVQSRRSSRVGARVVEVTAGDEWNS